ncbi:hypothetical protein [Shewanella zhangzhouensis]|uniref:hypothetical protein n=1 Tax=Shewanella zhangzhouensis TaxID=2864213 RepID=UPI001C661EDB|nr:hypothetical protein [Shewanella zhangzhouensis]QYK06715.1 hypothetical protein K0H63_07855 [Shewanella zhangzhouensis]
MNMGLLGVVVLAMGYVTWLWRCVRRESHALPQGSLHSGLASALVLLLTCVNLMLFGASLNLFSPTQAMVLCCVFALFYGVQAVWLAGLAWLEELPQSMGSRWLWLGSAGLCLASLLACGFFDSISL